MKRRDAIVEGPESRASILQAGARRQNRLQLQRQLFFLLFVPGELFAGRRAWTFPDPFDWIIGMRRCRGATKQNADSGNSNDDPSVFHTGLFRGPGMALASVSHATGSASRIRKYSTPPIGHTDLAARFLKRMFLSLFCRNAAISQLSMKLSRSRGSSGRLVQSFLRVKWK